MRQGVTLRGNRQQPETDEFEPVEGDGFQMDSAVSGEKRIQA